MVVNNFYIHRTNTISDLSLVNNKYGIEIDLRYDGDDIILHHDPFKKGVKLQSFLNNYNHNGIILNCKSEGIEYKILEILKEFNINDFFFLDLTIPFLIKTSNEGCKHIAVRFSEYEPKEFIDKYLGVCEWVWIDSFFGDYFNASEIKSISKNFKICLMSPELRGFDIKKIDNLKSRYQNLKFDAICTKNPDLWK